MRSSLADVRDRVRGHAKSVADTAPRMSALVFVKLFAIFAVVAIGWGAAKSGRLGRGDAARVLSGAAFYIFVPALLFRTTARIDFARLDVAHRARLLRADAGADRCSSTRRCACAARAGAGAADAERARDHRPRSATRCRSASRSPPRCTAKPAWRCTSRSSACTALDPADRPDRAGRARPRARAPRRGDRGGTRLLANAGDDGAQHRRPSGRAAGARRAGLERVGRWRCPGFADEILATLGQAVVPLCLVLIGVSLAHYGVRGALRAATLLVVAEARRPAARGARVRARRARPDRRAARDRRDDGGAAGRQQRADLRPALPDAAGPRRAPRSSSRRSPSSSRAPLWLAVLHAIG